MVDVYIKPNYSLLMRLKYEMSFIDFIYMKRKKSELLNALRPKRFIFNAIQNE